MTTLTITGIILAAIGIAAIVLQIVGKKHVATATAAAADVNPILGFMSKVWVLIVGIVVALAGVVLILFGAGVFSGNNVPGLNDPTVSLSQASETISVGETFNMGATTRNTDGNITYVSDNLNVATVDNDGNVTGIGTGTANITAASGNAQATCKVTVNGTATEGEDWVNTNIPPAINGEPENNGAGNATNSDAINPDYALLVSDVKLMLDDGATDSEITTTLVSSGKTEAEATQIIADARNLKGTVDGLVDNGLLSPEQASDPNVLIQFAGKVIRHAYTVTEWDDLEMGGVFELVEYGQAFSQAKNIKGDINTVGGNIIVLVWGDNVTINGTNLGRSVTLVYPDRIAQLEIVGGGIRPFATTPTQSAYHWEARLLADASIKMGGGTAKYRLLDDSPEPADGIVKEFDGVSWVENPQKPGEFMLPEEAMGTEVLVKFSGTAHFGLNAVKIANADGEVVYEILAKNSTDGKDFYGNDCKVDAGVPQGWTVEYSRDGRILGVQGNGYLLVKNGATYWPGFYEEVFKYAQ